MSSIAAIIPARWGSTRFPGKALHPIAGKPLIQHVWERAMSATALDGVIIATDDMKIADAAFAFGAEVALTSPRHTSGTDRIAEVAKKLPASVTHIINVQGDEPAADPALINRLAKTLAANPAIPMITAANPFAADEDIANPNAVKVVLDRASDALYFSRSPIPYPRDKSAPRRPITGTRASMDIRGNFCCNSSGGSPGSSKGPSNWSSSARWKTGRKSACSSPKKFPSASILLMMWRRSQRF